MEEFLEAYKSYFKTVLVYLGKKLDADVENDITDMLEFDMKLSEVNKMKIYYISPIKI